MAADRRDIDCTRDRESDNFFAGSHRKKFCINCGKSGHGANRCKDPVMSYGIILMKAAADGQECKVLLVRRKDSMSFVEFVRGKYSPEDHVYLEKLCEGMTLTEQDMLRTCTFSQIWSHIWGNSSKSYNRDYAFSESKYNDVYRILPSILDKKRSIWTEPEWGFPKGRRNQDEADLDCALREFYEETNISSDRLSMRDDIPPLIETFYGSNRVHYSHIYHFATCDSDVDVRMECSNSLMVQEIGNIGWFSEEEACKKFHQCNPEKLEVLRRAFHLCC